MRVVKRFGLTAVVARLGLDAAALAAEVVLLGGLRRLLRLVRHLSTST